MTELAIYASLPNESRGRLFPEVPAKGRTCYQRDRDRILHCSAFRRLKGKTQVFVVHEDEDYRTRLTHTLEVAQISRSIARELSFNEDLTEALALSHDLGHSPFGHAGEEALNSCMEKYSSFCHNAQSLKVVTELEHCYANFNGLNLSWETLEGLAKHNGPIKERACPAFIKEFNDKYDLRLSSNPGGEAQIASICDDIAYNSHDIYDGLHAGLFSIKDISEIPFVGQIFKDIETKYPTLDFYRTVHEAVRKVISRFVNDTVAFCRDRLSEYKPKSADDIREMKDFVITFSPEMKENDKQIKNFLFAHMYRHYAVRRATSKGRRIIKELFELYFNEPDLFHWTKFSLSKNTPAREKAVIITDYISGLTDAAATDEYVRFFDAASKV